MSFADIEKNQFKFKKEFSLPPIAGNNVSALATTKHRDAVELSVIES